MWLMVVMGMSGGGVSSSSGWAPGREEAGPRGIVPGKPAAIVLHQGIVFHIHHHNVIML